MAQSLATLEGAPSSAPPLWLWAALLLGVLLRAYLIVYTEGTHDVPIWESHAGWTAEHGLIGYYGFQEVFNHPPFIGRLLSEVWIVAKSADVPFRVPHRAIFSLFDLGNALLLLSFFRASPLRYAIFASYWLNPLAIIFSAYHGNTDTAVAFFVLLAVSLAVKQRVVWTGVAIGVGLWFKLPTILAVPALLFYFGGVRNRLLFLGVAFAVGSSTYLSTAIQAWDLLYARVLAYPGLDIVTPGGVPVWGVWNLFGIVESLPPSLAAPLGSLNAFHRAHNSALAVLPILAFSFLRRRETEPRQLGVTVCGSLLIFHGLTNFWAYQYLAWLVPFLVFPGLWFFGLGTLIIGSFIYCLYVMLCGNFFLLGKWDFNAFAFWPVAILRLRDLAVLFCFASGAGFALSAMRDEWHHLRERGAP